MPTNIPGLESSSEPRTILKFTAGVKYKGVAYASATYDPATGKLELEAADGSKIDADLGRQWLFQVADAAGTNPADWLVGKNKEEMFGSEAEARQAMATLAADPKLAGRAMKPRRLFAPEEVY